MIFQLEALCCNKEIKKWDGYHEVDTDCLDGDGFTLHISYTDGDRSTSGSNCVPEGYRDFVAGMRKIINPCISAINEKERLKYIVREHDEMMDSVMICFSNSVYPKDHDIYFRAYNMDGVTRLEYRITLTNDDIYAKGEYHYYGEVSPEVFDFGKMDKIVMKYEMNKYHELEEYEEGGERYQIDYSYGDNYSIDFSGTKPFECYEEARQEIYEIIFSAVEATK